MLLPALALVAATSVQAIGFGRAPVALTLGGALDFPVVLRLEPEETIEPGCVAAEVAYGERRLAPHQVQVRLEPGADAAERLVRVVSGQSIDEPVVTVTVTAGCNARATRRITVFADPPLGLPPAAPQALPGAESVAGASAPLPTAGGGPATPGPLASTGPAPAARSVDGNAARPQPPAPAASVPATTTERMRPPRPPGRERATAARSRSPTGARAPAPPGELARARPAAPARAQAAAPAPRLRLEAAEVNPSPAAAAASAAQEALTAALRAASAADASATSAQLRVRSLEGQLDKVLGETRRQNEQIEALRRQIGSGQRSQDLLPWLGALLAVLAVGCVWLALQVRRLRGEREAAWWMQTNAAGTASTASDTKATVPAAPSAAGGPFDPPTAPPVESQPASETQAMPVSVAPASVPAAMPPTTAVTAPMPREVSVEELIDLEQQAEFFVVLGQDEAAIDLLVSHIRSTGGTSPLPYLKLLEIHRRRDEREAYERTRARFNHRFNAYAPEWDVDMQQGRALVDYPQVVQRLQRAWRQPMDAMALLETLLFRTDGGELFELPAYRDVLMLYGLARDLIDREAGGAAGPSVDVLLPLGESQSFESTTPQPHLSLDLTPRRPAPSGTDVGGSAGGPITDVDLDLSEPSPRDVTAPGVFQDSSYSDSDFVDLDRLGAATSRPRRPQ